MGEIPVPKKSFKLKAPKVSNVGDRGLADYAIPSRLQGVVKGRVVMRSGFGQSEDKYKNPVITTLVRLGVVSKFMQGGPDALYVGEKEVAERVAKAEQVNALLAVEILADKGNPSCLYKY